MPADSPKSPRTAPGDLNPTAIELDRVTTPFSPGGEVDLLLSDLEAPPPRLGVRGGADRAVLVVDSTPIARKFLALRLQSLGYRVHVAEGGEQALAMVEQRAYAIVFVEAVLAPRDGIDGLRLCQAIKRRRDHPGAIVPVVVVVTSLDGSTDRVRGSLAGCDAYLIKPLVKDKLIAALCEVDPLFK